MQRASNLRMGSTWPPKPGTLTDERFSFEVRDEDPQAARQASTSSGPSTQLAQPADGLQQLDYERWLVRALGLGVHRLCFGTRR